MRRASENTQYARRGVPATIAGMISIAAWKADGDTTARIAGRCRRPVREVRAIMEDREI
ncbi:hypothetical protein JT366_09385 [Sphingomonas paucimobilis]|uniref:hypothetical protein n=1 Tax=Sphingomonas paucimobilis TaxID=13689 RepID=UPI0019626B81|nr:hypothetical protein [Sphingomonas paucimobilis]QRY97111.1 hypothetical protein JT366_07710 [Sphingomonas paucimobilis]QRY97278.1 hypothetical protein JT366_08685 [Sphingomonas paucimobilis]QRY97405.1 hypothetical protein JT366_09385 [Sphingomonas paucimobilis]